MNTGRVVLAGAALVLAGTAPTRAVDWSLTGVFSERVAVEDRDETDDDGDGVVLRSTTDLGATIRARTKRADWTFTPGVRGFLSSDSSDTQDILPRFNGAVRYAAPRHAVRGSLSVIPDFTSESQFEDSGLIENDVLQFTTLGDLALDYRVDPRNTLTLGGDVRFRTFTESTTTLDDTQNYGLTATWTAAINSRTSLFVSPRARLFRSSDRTNSDGQSFSLVGGVEHALNTRMDVSASLGPSITNSTRDTLIAGGFREDESTDFGVVGGAGLVYRTPRSTTSVSFDQSVDQDSNGVLENRSALSLGWSYRLTPTSRVSVDSSLVYQNALSGGDDDRQSFFLSPRYALEMTEDWTLNAGYRFRASNDDDFGVSNLVFVEITRGLSFLP